VPSYLGFPALICKNCSRPIPLPPPTHPDISQHQPWWPMDGLPRNFLCSGCKHVFEYTAQDAHRVPVDPMAQDQSRKFHIVVCIEVPCCAEGCEPPVKIHTLMASDADLIAGAAGVLAQSTAHEIPCSRGTHFLSGPCGGWSSVDAKIDGDWEPDRGGV
jgi:hypothetical protein